MAKLMLKVTGMTCGTPEARGNGAGASARRIRRVVICRLRCRSGLDDDTATIESWPAVAQAATRHVDGDQPSEAPRAAVPLLDRVKLGESACDVVELGTRCVAGRERDAHVVPPSIRRQVHLPSNPT